MIDKAMTVAELAAALAELISDGKGSLPVMTEGCDCEGPCGSVEVYGYWMGIDKGSVDVALVRRGS